jgi:YfiH family protein
MNAWPPSSGLGPDWDVAPGVRGWVTYRTGGISAGVFGDMAGAPCGLNLADHVGDNPACVAHNRHRVQQVVPAPMRWLQQQHGIEVHDADEPWCGAEPPCADAAVAVRSGVVLVILTADCLPIFLADAHARGIGLVHAGWRGLVGGIAERTVAALKERIGVGAQLYAWLGPAISARVFEVGAEVRAAFCAYDAQAVQAFHPSARPGHWYANLYQLARQRLHACGIEVVTGGERCTVTEPTHFYSYRRDGRTGRMASLLWLEHNPAR